MMGIQTLHADRRCAGRAGCCWRPTPLVCMQTLASQPAVLPPVEQSLVLYLENCVPSKHDAVHTACGEPDGFVHGRHARSMPVSRHDKVKATMPLRA